MSDGRTGVTTPPAFTVTSAGTTAKLDANRKAQVAFTATNTISQPLKGRARVVPVDGAKAEWLTIDGDAERPFAAGGTQQYTVQINVPAAAPAGKYTFRLKMVGVANPDELFGEGPVIAFEVPKPAPPPRPIPWLWIVIAVIALLVLLGGGFAVYKLVSGGKATGSLDKAGLTFGDQEFMTASAAQTVTVTATGSADLPLGAASVSGQPTGEFKVTQDKCSNATLKPKGTCTIQVVFAPSSPGARAAVLTIANTANQQMAVALSGTGIKTLDRCKAGFVWRLARPTDHVCVTPATAQQVIADNLATKDRYNPSGPYGPYTCVQGYVWREAFPEDLVCVTGATRQQAWDDNAQAKARLYYQ